MGCGQFTGNGDIRNNMARSRFEDIIRNLHFSDNTKDDKSGKVRSLINHFNQSFINSVSNDDSQSIDKHMVKLKGRSSITQYVKNKPVKWGLRFWYPCTSETGYLCQFDLYLGKKRKHRRKSGTRCCFKND